MDTMFTSQFALSFFGGAFATSILTQMVKNAFNGFIKPMDEKFQDLLAFAEVLIVAALVALAWECGISKLGLEDQLTFSVRWIFYVCASTLVYRWFTKKVMADFMRRTPDASE